MANKFVSLLVLGCVFFASALGRAEQYTSAKKEQKQCIPEQELMDKLHEWCDKKHEYDPAVLKEMYTEDAVFQYMDEPEMKVQDNIKMMAAFMKEFSNFYNISKCVDFAGTYEFLGCEHNTIPAVLKGTVTFKGKDRKHTLNGPYSMEFKNVDGELKVSKFITKVAIEPSVFKKIWEKVQKSLPGIKVPELVEATTDNNQEEDDMTSEDDSQSYGVKKEEKGQCVSEKDLKNIKEMICGKFPNIDAEDFKKLYTKDATFELKNKPPMKVQDNIELMLAFKREFNAHFKITGCDDYEGITDFVGCESDKIPSLIVSTKFIKGTDQEHSLGGMFVNEFKYENGQIKVSKTRCTLVIEPSVLERIWDKVHKELEDKEKSNESSDNNEGEYDE